MTSIIIPIIINNVSILMYWLKMPIIKEKGGMKAREMELLSALMRDR